MILHTNVAVMCPTLMNPLNGRVSYSSTEYSSVATYTCDLGYEVFGPLARTCQANEVWSGSETTCQGESCQYMSSGESVISIIYTIVDAV